MTKRINLNTLPVHPIADLFPMMSESEFLEMKADIGRNGQIEEIVVWNGQLLDGRNRLRACTELGLDPNWIELEIDVDPVAWVVSHNLHRRHLTAPQRAMVADKLATFNRGRKTSNAHTCAFEQSAAAEKLNVSRRSVQMARLIRKNASKEVIDAVERGEMSLTAAVATTKTQTEAEKAAREAKKLAEKAAKEAEKEAKRAEKLAAKAAAAKAREEKKAAAKAAAEKAKEEARAEKLQKLSTADQEKAIRNQIQQHIDRAVRLIDDLHHLKPNHSSRTVAVKSLQGIRLW